MRTDPGQRLAPKPQRVLKVLMVVAPRLIAAALLCALASDAASAELASRCPPGHKIDWARAPSAGDITEYYPSDLERLAIGGKVTVSCIADLIGRLEYCMVTSEEPPNVGLGDAALHLMKFFRVARPGCPLPGDPVRVPISFRTVSQ